MFIQTEQTPNPSTLKFLTGCEVMGQGTADFRSKETSGKSPLATRLFKLNGVEGVFLGSDFVTITKSAAADWPVLKTLVLAELMQHFTSGEPVMMGEHDNAGVSMHSTAEDGDSDVVRQIKNLLDTRVRPAVAQDGGDIVFHSFDNGVVYLQMRGACSGCPSSTATLKIGIENMLKHFIPEVTEVRPA